MKSEWKDEPLVVFDACALIAYLNDEPGADVITSIFQEGVDVEMAAINLLEIAYDAIRTTGKRTAANDIINTVLQLPISIRWALDKPLLEAAADWKTKFRISLADSVALALAESRQALLVTSDHHEFDPVEAATAARFLWIR
jgi:predicted nucleic acid-binding protein